MRLIIKGFLALSVATSAFAGAPDTSPRPVSRVVTAAGTTANVNLVPISTTRRPEARPQPARAALIAKQPLDRDEPLPEVSQVRAIPMVSSLAVRQAPRPILRPGAIVQKAMAQRQKQARGAVCGDPALQGETIGKVSGRLGGCGIRDAVRLRSVNGITLSQQALINCTTAKTLKRWVDTALVPAVGSRGGGVARITVAAHYACRSRNNQKGAKISEHGKGRAIDISGFRLRDGSRITVLKGWDTVQDGLLLRRLHKAACGPFGTVLGPGSDGFHRDHFHFDTAAYRSGAYCR